MTWNKKPPFLEKIAMPIIFHITPWLALYLLCRLCYSSYREDIFSAHLIGKWGRLYYLRTISLIFRPNPSEICLHGNWNSIAYKIATELLNVSHERSYTYGDTEWLFLCTEKYLWSIILTQRVVSGHRLDTEYPLGVTFLVNISQKMTFLVRRLEMPLGNPQKCHFW